MRLILKALMCLCLLPAAALCQERISNVMVGPGNDLIRIVVSFIEEPSEQTYLLQTMIISLERVKNRKEQPSGFFVDLTSTVRNLSSGEKKQKILLLQWKKSGATELKCDGKWKKQDKADAAIEKIAEVTKSVIESVPLDAETPTETKLPREVEQKVLSVLNSLRTENLPCLRSVN
ncbi:MAG TPA: hypothetical protein VGB00_03370 [Pyrinomonadaceae bacterium]